MTTPHRPCAGQVERLGALVLARTPLAVPDTAQAALVLAEGIARNPGPAQWPWNPALLQWRARGGRLHAPRRGPGTGLAGSLGRKARRNGTRLARPLSDRQKHARADHQRRFSAALGALLTWKLCRRSTGQRRPISRRRRAAASPSTIPAMNHRSPYGVQELFGLDRHPAIAGGRLPLVLALLSPARRPIQSPRPARFLARLLGRCAGADARALSTTSLARRSSRCQTEHGTPGRRQFRLKRLFRSDHIANHLLRQYPKARPTASSAKWRQGAGQHHSVDDTGDTASNTEAETSPSLLHDRHRQDDQGD